MPGTLFPAGVEFGLDREGMAIDARPGSYVLLLRLEEGVRLRIGRLGTFEFAPGWLLYTGSALGPGGLRARLAHHLKPAAHPHWHIDHLRAAATVAAVWVAPGSERRECQWAAALAALEGATLPAPRFGASDCRCAAHLVAFPATAYGALVEWWTAVIGDW